MSGACWTAAGLLVDLIGVLVLGWGVLRLSDEKVGEMAKSYMLSLDSLEKLLQRPVAVSLLADRARARSGLVLIFVGFVLQLVGALV